MLPSGGPSNNCLFWAFVDSSITVASEPNDDDYPWDAHDGDHPDKDEPSEDDSSKLLSMRTRYCVA